jgi:hypothetical protein
MAVPAHEEREQLMVLKGRFMAENDGLFGKLYAPRPFFCSVLSPQHSVLIDLGRHPKPLLEERNGNW